jgi:uncharacterized membrane protein YfcA
MADLTSGWPMAFALVFTGSLAGLLAGLFGIGGGLVIVPVLFFLLQGFDVSLDSAMAIATATSLATIVPTALSSTRAHYRKGNVDTEILRLWGPVILVAAILGSALASNLQGRTLTIVFGVLVMLVSANMIFRANSTARFSTLPNKILQSLMAAAVGSVSVMVGIGGATLGVPLLTAFNVKAHTAVGTAAAFGLLIALPGVLTLLALGNSPTNAPVGTWRLIHIPAFLMLIPLTVLFAPVGAKLGSRLNPVMLKRAFAVLLFFTGARMLIQVAA